MRAMLIAAISLLLLQGCGQKGPLYLPQDSSPAAADATTPQPTDEAPSER